MPKPELPDEDHFARQCTGKKGKDFSDDEDGYHQPPWLHGRAFQPTTSNPHLSGLWVEQVADTWEKELERVKDEFKKSNRTISKSYQLAIIQIRAMKDLGRRFSRDLHVLYTPDYPANLPSHAEVRGICPEDEALHQMLSDIALIEPIYSEPKPVT